jgi:hypothetical protein
VPDAIALSHPGQGLRSGIFLPPNRKFLLFWQRFVVNLSKESVFVPTGLDLCRD